MSFVSLRYISVLLQCCSRHNIFVLFWFMCLGRSCSIQWLLEAKGMMIPYFSILSLLFGLGLVNSSLILEAEYIGHPY